MDFNTWWRIEGKLDEGGKEDWMNCWNAAIEAAAMKVEEETGHDMAGWRFADEISKMACTADKL
jgi:hypothetical protein